MTAPEVLERIRAAGVTLTARDGSLIAKPRAAVTPEVLELLKAHKADLLAAIEQPAPSITFERRKDCEYPRFIIGGYSFVMEVPKDKYDPFAILALFEKYHGGTVH